MMTLLRTEQTRQLRHKWQWLVTLLLLSFVATAGYAETYPARCRVKTSLNVRSGPSTGYSKIGALSPNSYVTVNSVIQNGSSQWGEIDYNNKTGYVSMRYLAYESPIQEKVTSPQYVMVNKSSEESSSIGRFLHTVWKIVRIILIGLAILLLIAFVKAIIQILAFLAVYAGIGALVFHILFGNAGLGANVGFCFGVFIGLRMFFDSLDMRYADLLWIAYLLISAPLFWSNRLQHVLTGPWRYMFKTSWLDESYKPTVRTFFYILQILLYIVTTPLRVFNAIGYNIIVYGITELYDLSFEVLQPSSYNEGKGSLWRWIVMLPYRIVKYPLGHGGLAIIEGMVWTVVDIFIPAVTMYHGTDLTAGQLIASSGQRNKDLRDNAKWTQGTFTASKSSWGGIGVYFTTRRRVAASYAHDPYRLSDNDPVMIVCRVSLGKILSYGLAPHHVYSNAGWNKKPAVINDYAEKNGYTTGEWWNGGNNGYWEYCMFDWKDRYNECWRIRPVYIFNFRTSLAQHVNGGMHHWLFDGHVAKDIERSLESILG